jgi:hypothetical protein
MPFIKPGPGQGWCPCCELLFTKSEPGQQYCTEPTCLARRDIWRIKTSKLKAARSEIHKAQVAGAVHCPDCGGADGRHANTCVEVLLRTPCRICGRMIDRTLPVTSPDAMAKAGLVPAGYLRAYKVSVSAKNNFILLHARCRDWQGNRLPRDISKLQPPWGVKPEFAKVTGANLPPGTEVAVRHPARTRAPF